MREKTNLEKLLNNFEVTSNESKDLFDIYDLAIEEHNDEMIKETTSNIKILFNKILIYLLYLIYYQNC